MAYLNPSFETADPANPGLAQSWTLTVVSFITIAGYALTGGLERAWEDFDDGWATGYRFETGTMTAAQFSASIFVTPPTREAFEIGWATNQAFAIELGATVTAAYGAGADNFESFEVEWFSGSYDAAFDEGIAAATPATYGVAADDFETFELQWFSGSYATTLAGTTTAASYGGAVAYEDFSPAFAPVAFIADPSTDTFSAPGHGMSNGKRVRVVSSEHLPTGLASGDFYFVVGATTNTFQLAATSGGSAVDVTSPGAGTHTVISDGATEWGLLLD